MSGNSSMLAMQLQEKLAAKFADRQFEILDVMDAGNLNYADYDLIIFLCSTWDDGQPNINGREYLQSLTSDKTQGKKWAVIGLGDSAYPHFCGAVPIIEARLKELGANLAGESFKVDGMVDEMVVDKVVAWVETVL